MFWLRKKKNNFLLRTLIWGPVFLIDRRSLQEAERLTHDVSRSDSCMSLGAMAEKVDPSLPLEDQK